MLSDKVWFNLRKLNAMIAPTGALIEDGVKVRFPVLPTTTVAIGRVEFVIAVGVRVIALVLLVHSGVIVIRDPPDVAEAFRNGSKV